MPEREPFIPTGGRRLEFDFPGLAIGVAEYEEGPTGCTVFHFERGASFAADVRGGSPGTVGTDYGFVHAICLAGGSLMGLEASRGVAAELYERRGHEHVEWNDVPLVAGAIIFDFGFRKTSAYPDLALGRAAMRAAVPGAFPLGRRGAGRSATAGKLLVPGTQGEPSGQGGAFRQIGDVKLAAFSVVNAVGAIHDRGGKVVRGNLDPTTGLRSGTERAIDEGRPGENTTLSVVVTNQRLAGHALTQFARQVHASMARAIQPFHTANDGDTLFAVTTNAIEGGPLADPAKLGMIASRLDWDAVLCCWDP